MTTSLDQKASEVVTIDGKEYLAIPFNDKSDRVDMSEVLLRHMKPDDIVRYFKGSVKDYPGLVKSTVYATLKRFSGKREGGDLVSVTENVFEPFTKCLETYLNIHYGGDASALVHYELEDHVHKRMHIEAIGLAAQIITDAGQPGLAMPLFTKYGYMSMGYAHNPMENAKSAG
jgi:hypothetical protein